MKPKDTRKVIRMIVITLVVNIGLVFSIARLAFIFEKTSRGRTNSTHKIEIVQHPSKSAGKDTGSFRKKEVTRGYAEGVTTSLSWWLISNSNTVKKNQEFFLKR